MGTLCALALGACADPEGQSPTPVLDILQVLPASNRLEVGGTAQLGAQRVTGSKATNVTANVRWSSDDEKVVRVSYDKTAGAVATAVGPGTAHIIADDDGTTAKSEFVVDAAVASLELDLGLFELAVGTTQAWGATLIGTDNTKRALDDATWGSSSPGIASVDGEGVVTGAAVGEARITLTRDGLTTEQPVFVRDWPLESVAAKAATGPVLLAGGATPIRVVGTFAGGHTQDLTSLFSFSVDAAAGAAASEDPIVTVEGALVIAGEKAGTATVNGTGKAKSIAADKTVTLELRVIARESLVSLTIDAPASIPLHGEIVPIGFTGKYTDEVELETAPDSLEADPPQLVFYDQVNGTLEPLGAGTTKLVATLELEISGEKKSFEATHALAISEAPISALALALASPDDSATIGVAKTTPLLATASFGPDVTQDVTEPAVWKSEDASIAVVSNVSSGRVTGLKAGTTTISATYKGKVATFPVTVTGP